MSPPLLGVEGENQGNASVMSDSGSMDCISQSGSKLRERNYLGLSDCSSVDSSQVSSASGDNKSHLNLNLKATELTLGLPGSQSPEHDQEPTQPSSGKFEEKPLFPLLPLKDGICALSQKTVVSGNKRGFSDTIDGLSKMKGSVYTEGKWMFQAAGTDSERPQSLEHGKLQGNPGVKAGLTPRTTGTQSNIVKEVPSKVLQGRMHTSNGNKRNDINASDNNSSPPAAKAQVVGWPPIRSFRKNTLAASKNNDEVGGQPGPGTLFIKVSMDGAPYLRKVDLRMYSTYQELSSALEKMFSCFTIGQCDSHGTPGKGSLSESKLRDLLRGSEYVLTYEDKDGDWMLVGDVPWEMFSESCKRLKIMKSSDAIGLAPSVMEKSQDRD